MGPTRNRRPEGAAKTDLKSLTLAEFEAFFAGLDEPRYRASQVAAWVFPRDVHEFAGMTDLSLSLRERLGQEATVSTSVVVTSRQSEADGTRKLLLEYADGNRVEAVVLHDEDRATGCVSTQIGCRFGCSFCATGNMGFVRNLTAGEIVEEIQALRRLIAPERLDNTVFMGMGEPLDNYDATMKAVRIANAPWGLGIGARKITISTAGIIPGILRLAEEGLQVNLAVSLNAPTQELRARLMPVAEVHPLEPLVDALREYTKKTGRTVTLEYVLLREINDSPEMADALGRLARSLLCKVNIIGYNENSKSAFSPPADKTVEAFAARLRKRCPTVVRRISRGADIAAGCGQLCVGNSSPSPGAPPGARPEGPEGPESQEAGIEVSFKVRSAFLSLAIVAVAASAAAGGPTDLEWLVGRVQSVLPLAWRVVEADSARVPIGWYGEASGLYVEIEDTRTRFFHPSGFHYYSFYHVWLMPPSWEGEMRMTPYVSDSAPAYLLGAGDDWLAFYHTAGGNVWYGGPAALCAALGLDRICYAETEGRIVDLAVEERLSVAAPGDDAFRLSPNRIVGLTGAGSNLYLEYVFPPPPEGGAPAALSDLTAKLAETVFSSLPEVESLYLRRCTVDSFTDTIVQRD